MRLDQCSSTQQDAEQGDLHLSVSLAESLARQSYFGTPFIIVHVYYWKLGWGNHELVPSAAVLLVTRYPTSHLTVTSWVPHLLQQIADAVLMNSEISFCDAAMSVPFYIRFGFWSFLTGTREKRYMWRSSWGDQIILKGHTSPPHQFVLVSSSCLFYPSFFIHVAVL